MTSDRGPVPVRGLLSGVERTLESARRQAPAARMVGEFAVKMLVKEAGRLASTVLAASSDRSRSETSTPDDATSDLVAAPWPPPEPTG